MARGIPSKPASPITCHSPNWIVPAAGSLPHHSQLPKSLLEFLASEANFYPQQSIRLKKKLREGDAFSYECTRTED